MARLGVVITLVAAGLLATPTSLPGRGGGRAPTGSERRAAAERPAGTLVSVVGSNRLSAIDVASGRRTARRLPGGWLVAAVEDGLVLRRGRTVVV
jgi:hypothetical protein